MAGATTNIVSKIPEVVLSSSGGGGKAMPVIGFGTAADSNDGATMISAALEAIKLGYRHFDTASAYGSEKALGEAISQAITLGLVNSRDDLFITSKLWPADTHPHLVLPALQKSLRTLELEYLDLYLIHWPISVRPGKGEWPFDEEDMMPIDFKSVWAAMEECQRLGLAKSIGVSNFSCKKLEILLSSATIPPAVNQVEMSPIWQQRKLIEFCKANGIVVTAYSPLGATGASWGTNDVMDNETLNEIAKARGKTVAQVSLRWIYEQGATLVAKSYNKERLKENQQIFDWELSEDDCKKISQIKQHRLMPREELTSARGPYKSLDEMWDGEL